MYVQLLEMRHEFALTKHCNLTGTFMNTERIEANSKSHNDYEHYPQYNCPLAQQEYASENGTTVTMTKDVLKFPN